MPKYTLSDFDYSLPNSLIAKHPVQPKSAARLLCWNGAAEDKTFANLAEKLNSGDLLILNNTKVIPARIFGKRKRLDNDDYVNIELLLHRPINGITTWEAFAKPAKRLKQGQTVEFETGVTAEVLNRNEDRVHLKFNLNEEEIYPFFEKIGSMPLPPYIEREVETEDKTEYQTVYAKHKGSVAAPTAGLHFDDEMLKALKEKGVNIAYVTLHVGAGTFLPVRTENLDEHVMHIEWGELKQETVEAIKNCKNNGGNVVAVGTTSMRVIESAANFAGEFTPWSGDTNLFITPGYKFKVTDVLITNFHLPKSTLLMLVSAFIGYEEMQKMYNHAIENEYRFYSYGDGCLLKKKDN